MRLNAGTVILIVVALVVIIGVVILTNQQAAAPGDPTPTPATAAGPVFTAIDPLTVDSAQLVNHGSGEYLNLTKDSGGAWAIAGTFSSDVTPPDQDAVNTQIGTLASLQHTDRFEASDMVAFGLNQPLYSIILTTANGGRYTLYIGGENPAGNRYYAVAESTPGEGTVEPALEGSEISTPEATAEATAEAESTAEATADAASDRFTGPRPSLSGTQQVLLINSTVLDPLIRLISLPPYAPTPTPTATATATPNPYSEVEMTATAAAFMAQLEATATANAAQATAEVTAEATAEATAAP